MSSKKPRIIELTDLPRADPNLATVVPIACGSQVYAVYQVASDDWSDEGPCAAVAFDRCRTFLGTGPNDEALHNHPLFKYGLRHYAIQEVVDSPWVEERARLLHKDSAPHLFGDGQRHFVFALKENSFECTAESYSLLGMYPSYREAMEAVLARIADGLRDAQQ
jgi:hypothetical protein